VLALLVVFYEMLAAALGAETKLVEGMLHGGDGILLSCCWTYRVLWAWSVPFRLQTYEVFSTSRPSLSRIFFALFPEPLGTMVVLLWVIWRSVMS